MLQQFFLPAAITLLVALSGMVFQSVQKPMQQTTGEKKLAAKATVSPTPIHVLVTRDNKKNTQNHSIGSASITLSDENRPATTETPATPTPSHNTTITAQTSLSTNGKTIYLAFSYPQNGGVITGTISGDCTGTITGQFEDLATRKLSGNGKASCSMGFFSVPAEINFTGKLLSETEAAINYTVSAMGQVQSGNTMLNLSH